jgi:hypothetical protein
MDVRQRASLGGWARLLGASTDASGTLRGIAFVAPAAAPAVFGAAPAFTQCFSTATGFNGGCAATVTGADTTAFGSAATATGDQATAFGRLANAVAASIAAGPFVNASGSNHGVGPGLLPLLGVLRICSA